MKARRHFGHLLLAVVIASVIVLGSVVPSHAADLTGKKVTAVSVSGNHSVPESDIMAVVKLKPGDTLSADKVQQDLRAIYELGSFFDVVSNFTEVPEGVKVVYTVMENPALKDIVVKGNTKVSTDKIKSMLTVSSGKVLNTKTLSEDARKIEGYYHDQGYVLARISDVAMTPGGVLTITINEGMLEGITVKGNEKTKTHVITREMKVKPGEAFNAKDARRSMQKVYNLGYFEDVNMKLNPGKEPNSVILETNVVEQKTGVFTIGGGYSQSDGLVGIIELGDNNFRGTGDKVKIHWEFGGKASTGRNYEFSYTRPWLDSKQTSLSVSLYNITNEYTDYGGPGFGYNQERATYDRKRRGWDLTLGRPQGEYIFNYITLKNRQDDFVKYVSGPIDYSNSKEPRYTNYLKDNFGLTRSVTLARVFDSRDNVFNPTEGSRFSLAAEVAGKGLGGDFNFNKYTIEAAKAELDKAESQPSTTHSYEGHYKGQNIEVSIVTKKLEQSAKVKTIKSVTEHVEEMPTVSPINTTFSKATMIWDIDKEMVLIQECADFYLLSDHVAQHPEDKYAQSVYRYHLKKLDRQFTAYLDMSIGGELRHSKELSHYLKSAGMKLRATKINRAGGWTQWKEIRDNMGLEALERAAQCFNEGSWSPGYGGKKWGTACVVLLRHLKGEDTPAMFVDTTWSLQHNGTHIFDKVWSVHGLQQVLDAKFKGDVAFLRAIATKETLEVIDMK
jgi:outer membrane protein insertion porin family